MNNVSYEPVGDIVEPPVDPPSQNVTGWRFLHRDEGGRYNPTDMPEVRNSIDDVKTEMHKGVQKLAWGVMKALNLQLSENKWEALHGYTLAMNNFAQNGYGGGIPHTNWINHPNDVNWNAGKTNPSYDKMRGYGGQLIQAYDEGSNLRVVPNVHCIDPSNLPTVEKVLEKGWYSLAVSINPNRTVSDFAQGNINDSYGVIAYLWISQKDVLFPKSWFQWWDESYYPDHLAMYVQPSLFSRAVVAIRSFIGV